MSRIAVLASAGGSNVQAILDYFDAIGSDAGTIAFVASDRPSAFALERARRRGIPAIALDAAQCGEGMAAFFEAHGIDLIALAGYLRFIPADVTRNYRGRILNVHPSLLPSFGGQGMYGMRVHQAVLAAGVRVSGVTVHFVNEEYDRGPIIAQWSVPVLPSDSAESLARRLLPVEHQLLPSALHAVARGDITLGSDNRVLGTETLIAGHTALRLSRMGTAEFGVARSALVTPAPSIAAQSSSWT